MSKVRNQRTYLVCVTEVRGLAGKRGTRVITGEISYTIDGARDLEDAKRIAANSRIFSCNVKSAEEVPCANTRHER